MTPKGNKTTLEVLMALDFSDGRSAGDILSRLDEINRIIGEDVVIIPSISTIDHLW